MHLSFIGIIFSGLFLFVFAFGINEFGISLLLMVLFVAFCLIFILSVYFQPIRLKNVGEHFVTVVIKNNQYANFFSAMNKKILV